MRMLLGLRKKIFHNKDIQEEPQQDGERGGEAIQSRLLGSLPTNKKIITIAEVLP